MANFIQNLIAKRNGNSNESMLPYSPTLASTSGIEIGNINQIGYEKAGRNNGDPAALNNSFQLIKSGQIVDENNNEQKRKEAIAEIDRKINEHREEISKLRSVIEKTDQVELPSIERETGRLRELIEQLRNKASEIKYDRNRFNHILTWTGFLAGFIYLYLFYVSAIHSALFRNIAGEVAGADKDSIGILLNNVFNISAFREFNIHWFAPVVFFIFALILHFALGSTAKSKWISVSGLVFLVLIADGLLAYSIENNNHTISRLMGLSDGT